MSRVHAVRLLTCCGWLLMIPPLEKTIDTYRVGMDRPISEWVQSGAFDSARACQDAKAATLQSLRGGTNPPSPTYLASVAARCIPADHLYPPRPPNPK